MTHPEITAMLAAASPAPWSVVAAKPPEIHAGGGCIAHVYRYNKTTGRDAELPLNANARLIANAPTIIAGLLAEVEGLKLAAKDGVRIAYGVVANARRRPAGTGVAPLWAVVMERTGLGSTAAAQLCESAGFNPDSTNRETDRIRLVPEDALRGGRGGEVEGS